MKNRLNVLSVEISGACAELRTPTGYEGLRLINAFFRIRDPAFRAVAIEFVSELAERSEQSCRVHEKRH